MADFIGILDELEKVNLAPILVPALKMSDPLLGQTPCWVPYQKGSCHRCCLARKHGIV